MDRNKKIKYLFLTLLTSMLLFFVNMSTVQASFDSNIAIILYADGVTSKNGYLKLSFPAVGSEGELTYVASGNDLPFHRYFPGDKYIGIDIIRDEKVIFKSSVNGDTRQSVLVNEMKNVKIKDTDILHLYVEEPTRQQVTNADSSMNLPTSEFRESFKKDMYYMLTYGGFIPVNNGISHYIYDQYKSNTSATQMSSLFSNNILNFGYSGAGGGFKFFGIVEPDTQFHSRFPKENYYAVSYYEITNDHQLGSPIVTAIAMGNTTYSNMGNQLKNIQVMDGAIYKIFSLESSKVRLWHNGVSRPLKKYQKETYVEFTKEQGLVEFELDINKVQGKAVTVELGSKPENLKVEDFTNVTDYPNLSSSFKTAVRTDKLGTYNQEISIRQNLITASNYIVSTVSSKVTVVDTTPPMATNKENVKIPIYGSLPTDPAELLDNLKDNSGVENLKLEYLDETGDTSVPGLKKVKIRITDVSGNFTDVTVNLTIVPGSLTIKSVPNMDFGKIKIGESSKNVSQNDELDVVMSVDDLRGNGAGWTLQASISNFTTKDGKELNAQISLLNGVVSNVDNSVEGLNAFDISLNNHFQTIMQAKQGSGVKNSTVTFKNEDVSLGNISSDARIGLYEATINWVLLDTP